MKQLLPLIIFCVLFTEAMFGQCDPPPSSCPCQVEPICGFDCIDDYSLDMTAVDDQTNPSGIPGCNGVINNPTWFAFVAGSDELSIELVPLNCDIVQGQGGDISGIQAVLYGLNQAIPDDPCGNDNTGCNPLNLDLDPLATSCDCDATADPISFLDIPTVPGQTYYILIDGCGGSECNPVEINIIEGGDPPTVDDPGQVLLPPAGFDGDTVCPGASDYAITLDPVFGAGFYRWLLPDGSFTETVDPELLFTFPDDQANWGQEFDFCVRTINDCGESNDSTCFSVVVAPLDTVYDADIDLCEGDQIDWRGVTIGPFTGLTDDQTEFVTTLQNDPALWECLYVAAVNVNVINENDEDPVQIDTVLCEGESISIFGNLYSGNYTDEPLQGLTTPYMCDSFIELTVVNLFAEATYTTTPPVECSFPGMFQFNATSIDLQPSPNDPNTSAEFNWYRQDDNQLVFTSDDPIFEVELDDFNDILQVFELFITMTYTLDGTDFSCDFGPFELEVDLTQYIPSVPIIDGPDTVCAGSISSFFANELEVQYTDPDLYQWDLSNIPGASVVNQIDNEVQIQFDNVGAGQLCVRVQNNCFEADTCKTVYIVPGPVAGDDAFACDDTYTFSGADVSGNATWSLVTAPSGSAMAVFDDPSLANATVTVNETGVYQFSYGDPDFCSDQIFVTFLDSMVITGPELFRCDNANVNYTIEFVISGGLPPYSVASSNGTMMSDTFLSDPIASNVAFTVTIEDNAGCERTFSFDPHECSCDTEAGTMSDELLSSCGEACHQGVSNADTMMDGNDIFQYILHEGTGTTATNVLARNLTGEFCFIAGTTDFDVTYYISLIVGDDDGTGNVDLIEGCTRVAPGQPVVWYTQPQAAASAGVATCADSIPLTATPSAGIGVWLQVDGPGSIVFDDVSAPMTMARTSTCGVYRVAWFEDNFGCTDADTLTIEYFCNPAVSSILPLCNGTQTEMNVTINLRDGTEPYTEDFGRGSIDGSEFTIMNLPLMTPDTFYFTDANGCMLTVPVDVGDCSCVSAAGTMGTALVSDCQDQALTLTYDGTDEFFDANDSLRYMAHTRSDDTLGTVIAVSATPMFSFGDGAFECDSIYYVSAVVGNWTGTEIDVNDPCINVSVGQSIRFDCSVTVDAGNDYTSCDLMQTITGTSSTGQGTWTAITSGVVLTNPSGSSSDVEFPGPGTYELSFRAENGDCEATDNVTITIPSSPVIDASSLSFECNNDNDGYTVSFLITGGEQASYTVVGTTTGSIDGTGRFTSGEIPSGDPYNFEVFDQFDCNRDNIDGDFTCPCLTMVGSLQPVVENLCEGDVFDAGAIYDNSGEVRDGNDALNYILSDNSTDPTSNIISVTADGVFPYLPAYTLGTEYFVTVISGDETTGSQVDLTDPCLSVGSVISVTWHDRIDDFTLTSDPTMITCADPQVRLDIETTADLTGYTFSWVASNGGTIESGDEMIRNPRVNTAGTYTVTISHPLAGCAEMMEITIDQAADVPTVAISQPPVLTCAIQQITIDATGSTAGAGIEYEWSGPDIIGNNDGLTVSVGSPGNYTLTIRNTNNGCDLTGGIDVIQDVMPPAAVANAIEKIDCNTEIVTVSGQGSMEGNVTYEWTILGTGNILGATDGRDIMADQPGEYQLRVVNLDNGCESVTTATVEQEGNIINGFDIRITPSGCAGLEDGIITVAGVDGGVGPFTYSFDQGANFSSSGTANNLGPGIYPILVRDANGCEVTDTAVLPAPFDFFVTLGEDQTIEFGQEVTIEALTNLPDSLTQSIVWTPLYDTTNATGLVQSFIPPLGQYNIQVQITNENGCVEEDRVNVFVRFVERVYVPNAMRPSSFIPDNQVLFVYTNPNSVAAVHRFEVFDRWGNRMFQRIDLPVSLDMDREYAWDGTRDGKDAAPGTYVYYADVEFLSGYREIVKGEVILVR